MAASLGFLMFFSRYDQDEIDYLVEKFDGRNGLTFLVSAEFYIYVNYVSMACGIVVYLVIYHCLKRIDDDDRRNVFPNHDYSKDAICCTSGCSLKHCAFWTVYSIVFLFMLLFCLIVIGTFGGHTNFCKDDICTDGDLVCYVEYGEVAGCSEEGFTPRFMYGSSSYSCCKPFSGNSTSFAILAVILFGFLFAHQLYYNQTQNRVAADSSPAQGVVATPLEVALPILSTAVPPTDMTPEQVKELQMSLQQQQQQMTMMQQQLAAQQQQLMAAQPQQVTM